MTDRHDHQILTAQQAAQSLGCSVKTIEERARSGDLPGLLWGDGGWMFPAEAFYARVNELAIEQAAARRKPKDPPAKTASTGTPQKGQRRNWKKPPALPVLHQA